MQQQRQGSQGGGQGGQGGQNRGVWNNQNRGQNNNQNNSQNSNNNMRGRPRGPRGPAQVSPAQFLALDRISTKFKLAKAFCVHLFKSDGGILD